MKFYVQDARSALVGNCALWWRKERKGYTYDLAEAEQFDELEARSIERNRSTDRAIPVDVAESIAVRHVGRDAIQDAIQEALKKHAQAKAGGA